jgi:hypothetical protein
VPSRLSIMLVGDLGLPLADDKIHTLRESKQPNPPISHHCMTQVPPISQERQFARRARQKTNTQQEPRTNMNKMPRLCLKMRNTSPSLCQTGADHGLVKGQINESEALDNDVFYPYPVFSPPLHSAPARPSPSRFPLLPQKKNGKNRHEPFKKKPFVLNSRWWDGICPITR